jgi:hypothetical protein
MFSSYSHQSSFIRRMAALPCLIAVTHGIIRRRNPFKKKGLMEALRLKQHDEAPVDLPVNSLV